MARREREEVKPDDGFSSKLVAVNRITKVVKGGRNMRFSALVVVGDGKGSVGIGAAKAAEVPEAIKKAELLARRSLIKVAMDGNTIPHETIGQFGKSSAREAKNCAVSANPSPNMPKANTISPPVISPE